MSDDRECDIKVGSESEPSSSLNEIAEINFLIHNRATQEQIAVKKNWTEEEESAARRKIDFIIMPLLFIAFFLLQMDRGNISNALTDTFMKDIHIDTDKVNVGTALFNVGIVIFEIPFNIILQKVGPGKWLSLQLLVWSLIATLQCKIKNYGGFLATRFLLGMFEAGFIPGALFYLSTWYTKKELTARYVIYFIGNLLASAVSGLIASGILRDVAGNGGLLGWQWIFIIEGVLGVGYGLIFITLLPESTKKPRAFWAPKKFDYLTERQQYILSQRIIIDDPEKLANAAQIGLQDIISAAKQPTIWAHFVLSLSSMIHSQALSTYVPLIIKSLGYSKVNANARSSISGWVAIVIIILAIYTTNHFKPRSATIIFLLLWKLIFIIVLRALPDHESATVKFAILVVTLAPGANTHVLNTSWTSLNCKTPQERSIALAMIVLAANIAGICGGQVMREGDRPYYHKGFLAIIFVDAFALFWCIAMCIAYIIWNKKLDIESPKVDIEAVTSAGNEKSVSTPGSTTVVFVGKGDTSNDTALLASLNGNYHIEDKEVETVQGIRNFRYVP